MNRTTPTPRIGPTLARIVLAVSIGAGAALASGSALAADPSVSPPPKPGLNMNMGMSQIDKMLDKADATPDQRTKIKAILAGAFMSLAAIAPEAKATVSAFGRSLTAPRVDRADLETARRSAVADFDALSKVMVKALGDAADILSPEQRGRLAAGAAKHPDVAPASTPKSP